MTKARKAEGRQKGAAAEREFANILKTYGYEARRGQQYSGGSDSPDVVCEELAHLHFEVKRYANSCKPYEWMLQAKRDAGPIKTPIVVHRQDNRDWVMILTLADFMDLLTVKGLG